MSKRHDKCKCGARLTWDPHEIKDQHLMCTHCGTNYRVDCDSVLVYWLVEDIREQKPYTTEAR